MSQILPYETTLNSPICFDDGQPIHPTHKVPGRTLRISEAKAASPQVIEDFVTGLFDGLIEDISGEEFSEFFDLNIQEHADFSEVTTEAFIVRVLSRQDRVDELVTARVKRKRIANPFERLRTSFLTGILGDDETFSVRPGTL